MVAVFEHKDENGNRYLSEFLRDYNQTFMPNELNTGCLRCLEEYYRKLTKYFSIMSNTVTKDYQLHEKYDGVPVKFGSTKYVFNRSMTVEDAKALIKNHPKGKDLFSKLPTKESKAAATAAATGTETAKTLKPVNADPAKEVTVKSLMDENKRDQLDAQADALGIPGAAEMENKKAVATAILEVLNS